jgi:hypothetical protein
MKSNVTDGIKNALMEKFHDSWKPTLEKLRKLFRDEASLVDDLFKLQDRFGTESVRLALEEAGLSKVVAGGIIARLDANQTPPEQKARKVKVEVAKPATTKTRRRGKAKTLSFTELQPHVLNAIVSIRGDHRPKFTINDIKSELRVPFDSGHLNLILSRYITGIKVIGKVKIPGKGGLPLNEYGFTGGHIGLVKDTKKPSAKK